MLQCVECLNTRQKYTVYIHGVTPAVFHDRLWVKPVTTGVVLVQVQC